MGDGWLLLLCAGILVANSYLLWRLRTDDTFLKEYVRTSPKAYLWRRAFGEERAAELIRTRFVPLGVLLWTALLVWIGVVTLMGHRA